MRESLSIVSHTFSRFLLHCILFFFTTLLSSVVLLADELNSSVNNSVINNYYSSLQCAKQWQVRYFLQGPRSDWYEYPSCSYVRQAWWLPNLVNEKYFFSQHIKTSSDNGLLIFSADWSYRLHQLLYPIDQGPPKWMPPELAYWDSASGEWRYLHENLGADITKSLEQPDLMMLWLRYDRDGLGFDATVEWGRVLRAFNVIDQRFSHFWSRLLNNENQED